MEAVPLSATDTSGATRLPRNVTSVGALVVHNDSLLVVRMTYGPSKGRYMLPGGLVDPGETLDAAAVREVREETGIETRPVGIVGIRSRTMEQDNDTYVLWLLEPADPATCEATLAADGHEIEDCRFLPFREIAESDDCVYLVKYLAARIAAGDIRPHTRATDYAYQFPGTTPDTWKLFI
jgi:ADP-ribose pyrophosphatase YjhB (NUDIX family)